MKKFFGFVCAITCAFGLTACGEEANYTELEQSKLKYAEQTADYLISEVIDPFTEGGVFAGTLEGYSAAEVGGIISTNFPFETDGYTFLGAISSFNSGKETIGEIVEQKNITSKIDDDRMIVDVEIVGTKKNAVAELIFDKDFVIGADYSLKLESASLNPVMSTGELMGKAGLNTLVGMGTVFLVLIFISFIISLFKLIPKIQESFSKKKEPEAQNDTQAAQIQQTAAEEAEESDDTELVAVIAAAIAAFEGQTSTDGFVVRSIRKRNAG